MLQFGVLFFKDDITSCDLQSQVMAPNSTLIGEVRVLGHSPRTFSPGETLTGGDVRGESVRGELSVHRT